MHPQNENSVLVLVAETAGRSLPLDRLGAVPFDRAQGRLSGVEASAKSNRGPPVQAHAGTPTRVARAEARG
jgi:hypothetical protein